MAKDDYFSFGDEDLGGPAPVTSLPAEAGPAPAASTLAADAQGTYEFDTVDPPGPARTAPRSRGDLTPGSSEQRGAVSRWILIGLAIAIAIWAITKVGLPTLSADGPAVPPAAAVQGADEARAASTVQPADVSRPGPTPRAAGIRRSRDRNAERQRVEKHRSRTRNRSQRGRERKARGDRQPPAPAGASPVEAPAEVEYIPPPAESEPEPESAPTEPPALQDGSTSPEFGL